MVARKTVELLPSIFQTDTNRKFLSATLDQLVNEPEYTRLNGYVGRKFSPIYKSTDNYIPESDPNRQNYQLEPSIVIKNSDNNIEFFSNYTDLINKITYYGGITADHNRLFSSEYYTYTGLVDQDKLINFSQYYWLPNGPRPVTIASELVTKQATFIFNIDKDDNVYRVEKRTGDNPEILVARGGTYKFQVNQSGKKFYIQTEPGVSGYKKALPTVSTRDVYGVKNNGTDNGIVEFRVPTEEAQDVYLKMPVQTPVEFAIETSFSEIDGQLWNNIITNNNGFDGYTSSPDGKTLIFLQTSSNASHWTRADGSIIPAPSRRGVWRIRLTKDNLNREVVNLDYIRDVEVNNRIYARIGNTNANKEFYREQSNQFIEVPPLTAQYDILYYQSEDDPDLYGRIRLVNGPRDNINVDTSIIGKQNYTSPLGIDFINGLVIKFDQFVEPQKYANGTYVVEGVGRNIRLVNFNWLKFPEPGVRVDSVSIEAEHFDIDNFDEPFKGPADPQYITMNRGSLDLNAWSRHNRWFHESVLVKSAEINGTTAMFNQAIRATRPIIEFEPDLQLFNNGKIGKQPVDHIDTVSTDAFNQVQHSDDLYVNGFKLEQGQRILFPFDKDPLVRTQIYKIQYKIQDEPSFKSKFDGIGTGTISIESPKLDFMSTTGPELVGIDSGTYRYQWTVTGRKDLLTAIEIQGLDFPNNGIATVTSVTQTSTKEFLINFSSAFQVVNFIIGNIEIIGSGGSSTIFGTNTLFIDELEVGSNLYDLNDNYLGTVAGIRDNTTLNLYTASTGALVAQGFKFKDPRIQLIISDDPEDNLEPYDCLVATSGVSKGLTFWFDGTEWHQAQEKNKSIQPILFDVFDNTNLSFSKYETSKFTGTKIFSYRVGNGRTDTVLGFPLTYTSSSGLADITFDNNFETDKFEYLVGNSFVSKNIDNGFIKQNTGRDSFIKRNTWTTVNENSKQYQLISNTYNGSTNHFEIDSLPNTVKETPNIKVFLNNNLLTVNQYIITKVGQRDTVKIQAKLLKVGDQIDILVFSKTVSKLGFYQLPINLDYNSKNKSFDTLTLGQLRTNLITIGQNLIDLVGEIPGNSNLRNLDIRSFSGRILQHSSPVLYSSLFLIHSQANFISSLDFAKREYTKFKNKFLDLAMSLPGLKLNDAKFSVDLILKNLSAVKNKSFSWYYSDMVPYGEADVLKYKVVNTNQRQYKINKIFDDKILQSRAVLVYHNNKQLIKNKDFYFDQTKPAIQLHDHIITAINDIIEIDDFASTDGNYIPETPTKLGLYPKFLPQIYIDDTYRNAIEVIQGHDGSITPAFGDHRDEFLIELELRIYNNLKIDTNITDIRSFVPGRFRETDYSFTEFNRIINTNFLRWVGTNKVDYNDNKFFAGNDQFSYNYRSSRDSLFDQSVPGYWRGIYQYFYDTDRPHTHPWEMLGFTEQPSWWEDEYGSAPYTSGNTVLWEDLENGIIKRGSNSGPNINYVRPGLSKILPVDAVGNLIPPLSKIITKFSSANASESWQIGDIGPAEAAWRKTSEFPFALQMAVALMKPAIYFGSYINTNSYFKNVEYDQFIDSVTNRRINPLTVSLNGETIDGGIARSSGYINYIIDYLTNLGINGVTKLRGLLESLEVQLSYKVAGYTDKKYLSILAEQYSPTSTNESIIIPDDSYTVHLNKSVPVERISYSAVIVEKTATGFAVSGYNTNYPYFIVIPSETAGESYSIDVEGTTAVIYKKYRNQKIVIPYGTEFKNKQQMVDFLISYQRYLFAQGFVFDEYNDILAKTQDWELSVREFITWTTQGWKPGNTIVLSPVNTTLKVYTTNNVIDQITNSTIGSKLLDPNFNTIKTTEVSVMRTSDEFKVESITGKNISFAELNLVQFEHVLIFDNTTIFNDIIYQPESGSRQFRLKLVGIKTSGWDGSLSPQGFIYNNSRVDEWRSGKDYKKGDVVSFKNRYYVAISSLDADIEFDVNDWKLIDKDEIKTGLLPNFATNAAKFIDVYDVDSSLLDSQLTKMSNGLIGFRNRKYLDDLNITNSSQTKFYQGYIREKGTASAITNLVNATFNNLTNQVEFHEEWAVRVGEYGATEINRTVEIELDESSSKNNPVGITVVPDNTIAIEGILTVENRDLWNRPFNNDPIKFIDRPVGAVYENDIQSAGYVNIDDIDATIFDGNNYEILANNIKDISSGYLVWVAKDKNKEWNIYRASETDITIESISYGLDNVGLITTKEVHNLKTNSTIIIKNLRSDFDGFYTVIAVPGLREFSINLTVEQSSILRTSPLAGAGILFVLESVRFDSPSDIGYYTPRHGWKDYDRVWVDRNVNNRWAVYEKDSVWKFNNSLDIQLGRFRPEINYGTSVKLDPAGRFVVAGAAADQNGTGRIHVYFKDDNKERGVLRAGMKNISGLGKSIDMAKKIIVAGAPDSYTTLGAVVVYRHAQDRFFTPVQILLNPDDQALSNFGQSVSLSIDSKWLFVGSPGTNRVHYYKLREYDTVVARFDVIETRGILNISRINFLRENGLVNPNSLAVYLRNRLLIPGIEYEVNPATNRITLLTNEEDFPPIASEDGFIIVSETNTILTSEFGLGVPGTITVVQSSYYEYINFIENGSGIDKFGYSVKVSNNGRQVIVGAPGTTVNGVVQAGKAFVYSNDDGVVNKIKDLESTNSVYKGNFGHNVEICANNCSIYVGEPGYSDLDYYGGQVHRYVNAARLFGNRLGTIENPTVTIGHSIVINDVEIVFTGTSLDNVVTNINQARIAGVTAQKIDNKLYLNSIVGIDFNKLDVIPGNGTAFTDLGIELFESAQIIRKPLDTQGENFGEFIRISPDAETLAVSSTKGTAFTETIIDSENTTFDSGATRTLDITKGTGAVYFHDFLPNSLQNDEYKFGTFVYSQQFNAPKLRLGDQFGCGVDFNRYDMYIGASYNDLRGHNAGAVYRYKNANGIKGWTQVREQQSSVDVFGINSISLYNKKTKSKVANLDFVDPIKGKNLGIVEENLDYKTSQDPAMYNAGTNINDSGSIDFHWGREKVGRTWWNLDRVRYIDYEQDSLVYRLNNWGKLFPGSSIEVYEWVESDLLPSEWVASGKTGQPLYLNNEAYVQVSYADTSSGIIRTKYYYWVRGISRVNSNIIRSLSVLAIENAIRNNKAQNIPYAAIMSNNSIALFNCDKLISATDIILKIDYDQTSNSNLIHSEFELVAEDDKNSIMPVRIVTKIVDSLSGIDKNLQRVPDVKLKESQSIGLEIRPRQTLVIDRNQALKNVVEFINSIFKKTTAAYKLQNSREFDRALFFAQEAPPKEFDHYAKNLEERSYINAQVGDLVLVEQDSNIENRWALYSVQSDGSFKLEKNQTFKTTDLWKYKDWYAEGYDSDIRVDYIVDYVKDLEKIQLVSGNIVRVNSTATGGFEIYRYFSKDRAELIAVENGTIELENKIWDVTESHIGFDNNTFDEYIYDKDYSQEVRNILIGLEKDILIDDLIENYNRLLFVIVRYILNEQQNVDWIFKTSFISVLHKIKELKHYPNYIKDNHNYYENYINEVKPYRTKIRDYRVAYTGLDIAQTAVSDFDLPGYWDKDLKRFRSPSTEYPEKDGELLLNPQYIDWAQNFTSSVESITIAAPGIGFSQPPQIKIIANGDGGSGATAKAIIDEITGAILQIYITNAGSGYRNTPYIIINGDGTGARAYARLINNKIRSIKSTLKFDRISYNSSVLEWQPGVQYSTGQIVSYQGQGYRAKITHTGQQFNAGNFVLIKGFEYENANDRVAATYVPGSNQIPREINEDGTVNLDRLVGGVSYENNVVLDEQDIYNDSKVPSPKMADNTAVGAGDIRVVGGTFFDRTKTYSPEELVPGTTFDSLNMKVQTIIDNSAYIYRIIQDHKGKNSYISVSETNITELKEPLRPNDEFIFLNNINKITLPDNNNKVPGLIYINGELIKFWEYNLENNYIKYPLRGINVTGQKDVYPAGTLVEDLGSARVIPNTSITNVDYYVFDRKSPIFSPTFNVGTNNINIIKNKLEVYVGVNLLEYEKDYTFTVTTDSLNNVKVHISFVAANIWKDGIKINAKFIEDYIWLNSGSGTVTDGTGLAGSIKTAAMFIKTFPHNLP